MENNTSPLRSPVTLDQPVSVTSWPSTMSAFRASYVQLIKYRLDQTHNLALVAKTDQTKQLLATMHTELILLGSQPVESFGKAGLTAHTVHLRFLTTQAHLMIDTKNNLGEN